MGKKLAKVTQLKRGRVEQGPGSLSKADPLARWLGSPDPPWAVTLLSPNIRVALPSLFTGLLPSSVLLPDCLRCPLSEKLLALRALTWPAQWPPYPLWASLAQDQLAAEKPRARCS